MTIIAVLNQKGGVGKTTFVINIGKALSLEAKVLLVDSDQQKSLRKWHERNNGDLMPVIGLDSPTLAKDIQRITGYDYIIIDGGSKITEMLVQAIKCADIILIPVKASQMDIDATADSVDIIQARQQVTNGKPRAAFIISMDEPNTSLSREIAEVLKGFGIPVFGARVSNRTLFAKSSRSSTVIDDAPRGKAASEIYGLVEELKEFMK